MAEKYAYGKSLTLLHPLVPDTPERRLGLAVVAGDVEATRQALRDGARAGEVAYQADGSNTRDRYGFKVHCTAVFLAAAGGTKKHVEILRMLLAQGVSNVNLGDEDENESPLHVACEMDNHEAVEALMQYGANPNVTDDDGWTPCMKAAYYADGDACLRALAAGGGAAAGAGAGAASDPLDVNVVGTSGIGEGMTALDIAIHRGPDGAAAATYLRDELGALTGKQVRRRRACRMAVRELLHRRAADWLLHKHAAAKARVDFAPGGKGAQKAARSFALVAATQKDATHEDATHEGAAHPSKRRKMQRTEQLPTMRSLLRALTQ